MSRRERSGWRDQKLNDRHRLWGTNVPAVDCDAILTGGGLLRAALENPFLEYDNREAVALIEYKQREQVTLGFTRDANIAALGSLADSASVPAFVVCYKGVEDRWRNWWVYSVNEMAKGWLERRGHGSNGGAAAGLLHFARERDYVAFLYALRGRTAPASVLLMLDGLSLVEGVHEMYLQSLEVRDGADGRRVFEGVVRSVEQMVEVGRHLAAALDCEAEVLEAALRELREVPAPREVRVAQEDGGGNGVSGASGGIQMTLWEN